MQTTKLRIELYNMYYFADKIASRLIAGLPLRDEDLHDYRQAHQHWLNSIESEVPRDPRLAVAEDSLPDRCREEGA